MERSNRVSAQKATSTPLNGQANLKEQFRKLDVLLKSGLLVAFLAPLILLSLYFHFQFNHTLKASGKLHLAALAESQRNTIDLFLQERVVDIFSLSHRSEFSLDPSTQDMHEYLLTLRQASDAFIDVGFFDATGIQIGYAGPFPFLQGRDYSGEGWFVALMSRARNYHVSDVYLGFRGKPHFTIAVKLLIEGENYVLRATLDPNKFNRFLTTISQGKGIDSALINEAGDYQVVDPVRGEPLDKSDFLPARGPRAGVEEIPFDGDSIVVAYSWLTETPWALVIRQPLGVTYAEMYRVRRVLITSTALIVLLTAAAVWWITDRLVKRARHVAEAREELRSQLLHASKLASVGELATGVAHEINNPLAVIGATSGVIRDMLDPKFDLDNQPESIRAELDTIDTAVYRARDIIEKLMNFSRRHEPKIAPCNVNQLLDEVMEWFKERAFRVSDVALVRDYAEDLPELRLDTDQIRQVFLNLINNAGDAIDGSGTISLATRRQNGFVHVVISDTGRGMTAEQMEKIFLPFYTTKEVGKGTGLGLSISLSIVESMGGSIAVQSMLGAGSSFTVRLPIGGMQDGEHESAS